MTALLASFSLAMGFAVLFVAIQNRRKRIDYLSKLIKLGDRMSVVDQSVVDIKSLGNISLTQRLQGYFFGVMAPVGDKKLIKLTLFYLVLFGVSLFINDQYIKAPIWMALSISLPVITLVGIKLLERIARKKFEESFPDALNMMASAISAGESLMHAIIFVGKSLDTTVGKEFKYMGERLQIGEPPDQVLRRACQRVPYSEFLFFAITLRANINRGGQLKSIITRLNRLMFDARAIERKKMAMTSEARMSAKIVCSIPFIFLFILRYLSPENFNYIIGDPTGRYVLYYVLVSEAIGMLIIASLMRKVK
ncbi:type II secretion system F family protein [Parasalinivibrio latis]|uniref:type II secretion system F family protein n=1 Tax=Parasalinivibrio latis TaxID=2952610 RepID=UPI0030E4CFEC